MSDQGTDEDCYIVVCLDDAGELVLATRQWFESKDAATGYASEINADRKPPAGPCTGWYTVPSIAVRQREQEIGDVSC